MSLLDQLRAENPDLQNVDDERIVDALAQQPEFRGVSRDGVRRAAGLAPTAAQTPEASGQGGDTEAPGFMDGISAGVDQLQAMGGGLMMAAGDKLKSDALYDSGKEIYQRNQAEAQESSLDYGFTDISSVGEAVDWAQWTAGNLIPTMGVSLAGGGVGGVAARGLAGAVARETAEQGIKRQAATQIGQAGGAFGASAGMQTGQIMGETEDTDVALAHGAVGGALDALAPIRALRKLGGDQVADRATSEIAQSVVADVRRRAQRSVKGAAGREMALQGIIETGTEGMQTLIEQHAQHWVDTNGESLAADLGEVNWKQIADAAAAGALGGGLMGAPSGVIDRGQARNQLPGLEQFEQGLTPTDAEAQQGTDPESAPERDWRAYDTPPNIRRQRESQQADGLEEGEAGNLEASQPPMGQEGNADARPSDVDNRRRERLPDDPLDNDINVAQRMGFEDDADQLRFVRTLRGRAEKARSEGREELAERHERRAQQLYEDVYADPELSEALSGEYQARARATGMTEANASGAQGGNTYNGMAAPSDGQRRLTQDERARGLSSAGPNGLTQDREGFTGTGPVGPPSRTDQAMSGAHPWRRQSDAPVASENSADDLSRRVQAQRNRPSLGDAQRVYLSDNTPVETRYRVMDASELIASNDADGRTNDAYPSELQPRDRTSNASRVQVHNIVNRFNPERLGASNTAANGSPIVGEDGVVESGNGRAAAINRVYERGGEPARRYRDFVRRSAGERGISPRELERFENPVLVRQRTSEVDRADFARRANDADVAGMSSFEQALADADGLDDALLARWAPSESGDALAASNREFVRGFSGRLGNNEASRYLTRDGQATPELGARMKRAIFARAYQDEDMVALATEQDGQMSNLTGALTSAAGDLARAREYNDGDTEAAVGMLNDAVRLVRRSRQSGTSINELVEQGDVFDGGTPQEIADLARYLSMNMGRQRALDTSLRRIGALINDRAARSANGDMFGGAATDGEIFNDATSDTADAGGDRTLSDGDQRSEPGIAEEGAPDGARQNEGDEAPLLTEYTEQDLADRDSAAAAAAQNDAAQQRETEQRAEADREADDFTLTGSDRTADVAEARGQSSLLDEGAPSPETTTENDGKTPARADADTQSSNEGEAVSLTEQLSSISDDDLTRLIEDVERETGAPQTDRPARQRRVATPRDEQGRTRRRRTRSRPEQTDTSDAESVERTAGEIGRSMGGNLSSAGMEAVRGLTELFGGKGRLNSGLGFDEETYARARPHFAAMLRDFQAAGRDLRDFVRAIVDNFGNGAHPYILRFAQDVREGNIDLEAEATAGRDAQQAGTPANDNPRTETPGDVSDTGRDSQSDRTATDAENTVGDESVPSGSGRTERSPRAAGRRARSQRRGSARDSGVSEDSAGTGRTGGDHAVHTDNGQYGTEAEPAGRGDAGRGGEGDADGAPAERPAVETAEDTASTAAEVGQRQDEQDAADRQPATVRRGDADNIAEHLPMLMESQQGDVLFAEQRFFSDNGHGVLMANGTGTGKTYTGLGLIKRFVDAGQDNVLILVPGDKIARDWIATGKHLNLPITQLRDTEDNGGSGVVITTYANMRSNDSLAARQWDLVVPDEAHNLQQKDSFDSTASLDRFRALTWHPDGAYTRLDMEDPELARAFEDARRGARDAPTEAERNAAFAEAKRLGRRQEQQLEALVERLGRHRETRSTRVAFLSATPFAYRKSVDYAHGYLFDYDAANTEGASYNRGDGREQFFMSNFGYRMRYNKLTMPEHGVDVGLMEREFSDRLQKSGAMRARMIDVDQDYDRRFVLSEAREGEAIDEGLSWLSEQSDMSPLAHAIQKRFDYLSRAYLLEAINARNGVGYVRQHLERGRKAVVFHNFNKGGGFHPFAFTPDLAKHFESIEAAKEAHDVLAQRRPDLVRLDLSGLGSPISTFSRAFGERMRPFNGTMSKTERQNAADAFNEDGSGVDVILVQADAGGAGISLHDTTGQHQRMLLNLGLPVKPTQAIQIEGRIYRVGVQSNALQRYMSTGLAMERYMVSAKLAERSGTAENLAMGGQARALRDNIIEAYADAGRNPAGMDGEGTGGKAYDRDVMETSGFDRARSYYFARKKRDRRDKAREGIDFFATPEPLGYKMAEWAGIRPGDDVLEPSAGDGAIARFIPDSARLHAVEPGYELGSRLAMAAPHAKIYGNEFERHSSVNKYDAVVMNPPFGRGGSTAIPHLERAFRHLRDNGRLVALIPTGPAADKRFDAWLEAAEGAHIAAEVRLPTATFERAGTSVAARVLVIDKNTEDSASSPSRRLDLTNADSITEFFERIEPLEVGRTRPEPEAEPENPGKRRRAEKAERAADDAQATRPELKEASTRHAKKDIDLFVARMSGPRVSYDTFGQLRSLAKKHNGYWSKFARNGAIPGFQFESAADRSAFMEAAAPIMEGDTSGTTAYRIQRDGRRASGMRSEDVAGAIGEHPELAGVQVRQSAADLPDTLRTRMKADGVRHDEVRGIYHRGRVYLVADNLTSAADAVQAAVHETVGHQGLRGALGGRMDDTMASLYRSARLSPSLRRHLNEIQQTYTHHDPGTREGQAALGEELVAHMLETGQRPGYFMRAVAAIKRGLRLAFPRLAWSNADVFALGEQSRRWLERNAPDTSVSVRYSMDNAFAPRPAELAQYQHQLEGLSAQDRGQPQIFELGRTPPVMAVLGVPNLPMTITGGVIRKATADKHTVSMDTIRDLPRLLHDPVMVLGSNTTPDALVIMVRTTDANGRPVIVPLHVARQQNRLVVNRVASLYGRNNPQVYIDREIAAGHLKYLQTEMAPQWLESVGLSLPESIRAGQANAPQGPQSMSVQFRGEVGQRGAVTTAYTQHSVRANADDSDTRYSMAATATGNHRRQSMGEHFSDFTDADREIADQIGSPVRPNLIQRVGNRIGRPAPGASALDYYVDRLSDAMLKLRQGLVDRYASLRQLDEQAHGEDVLANSLSSSSWVLARMSSSASGALHAMMQNGRIHYNDAEKIIDVNDDSSTGLGSVLGRLGSAAEIERFMGWIAGNRAQQLVNDGRDPGFPSAEDAARMMDWNRGQTADGRDRAELYAEVFREFNQYRDDVLAIAEKTGLIDPEARKAWADEFYVPFYRVMDEGEASFAAGGNGLARQEAYKRLKGSTRPLGDLLENTIMNYSHLLEASLKNAAARQAMDNALATGIAQQTTEAARDKKQSTFIRRDGKKVWYNVSDPLVFRAVSALAHPGMNSAAMRTMRAFKRVFTRLVTSTPQFMVANLIRDSLQAPATSDVSKNAARNAWQGGKAWRDQRMRARMLASGGAFRFGHVYGSDPDAYRQQLTGELSDQNLIDDPRLIPGALRKGWDAWQNVNDAAENINRAAIFEQRGPGTLRAAWESRDLMDFSSFGGFPAIRVLIDIVPFLNARIQGLDKIYRSGVKPAIATAMSMKNGKPARVSDKQAAARFWQVTGTVAIATMALYLSNWEDERYQRLEQWERDTYWHFWAGDTHIRIPKPFEVGAIATMAERMLEQGVNDQVTGGIFAERVGHMLTDTFAFSPVPQMFQPALDVYANRDSFTGRPIETMGMERLSPELRTRYNTTFIAKGLTAAMNATVGKIGGPVASPVQVDALIDGYLGTIGASGAATADVIWRRMHGETSPEKHWYEYEPIRRFFRNEDDPQSYTRYSTLFYDGLREASRVAADVKALQEQGEIARAMEVQQDNLGILRLRSALNKTQRQLRKVRDRMDAIRENDAISPEMKRREIDRLRVMQNRMTENLGRQVEQSRNR